MLRSNKGFTLIEIIVVIIILGILSAIAVPAVTKNIATARVTALKNNLDVVKGAIDTDYAKNGVLTTTPDTLLNGKKVTDMGITYTANSPATNQYQLFIVDAVASYKLSTSDISAAGNFPNTPYAIGATPKDITGTTVATPPGTWSGTNSVGYLNVTP